MTLEQNNNQKFITKQETSIKDRLEELLLLINEKNEKISSLKIELKKSEENEKTILNKIFTTIDTIDDIRVFGKKINNKELLAFVENETKILKNSLRNIGVEEIPTVGELFNSKIHKCIEVKNMKNVQKDEVIEVVKQGYYQNGKVCRYAEVIIAK